MTTCAAETRRIIELDIEPPGPQREIPAWIYADNTRPGAKRSLHRIQALALFEAWRCEGLLASMGVGTGKTLVSGLLPNVFDLPEGRDAWLFVPPSAVDKTYTELLDYDRDFRISRRLHVESYGALSNIDKGPGWFDERMPGLLILDEFHMLANMESRRAARMFGWLQEHPEVYVAAMSGTPTQSSITDFSHISAACLRDLSPLPMSHDAASVWSVCMDEDGSWNWARNLDWQKMQPLVDAFGSGVPLLTVPVTKRKEEVRRALHHRLDTCAGVVLSSTQSTDAALEIEVLTLDLPPAVEDALDTLEELWVRPDGEALESGLEVTSVAEQLSQGFHYYWNWPDRPDTAWLDARSAFRSATGRIVKRNRPGIDSPGLVRRDLRKTAALLAACMGGHDGSAFRCALWAGLSAGHIVDEETWEAWAAWTDEAHKPEPPRAASWVSDFFIDDVIRRVREAAEPVLIWYSHREVADALARRGIEVCAAKQDPDATRPRTLALSVKSHGAALNLQGWKRNLVLCPTGSARTWEQLLGRTHRQGQDEKVLTQVYGHTKVYRSLIEKAKARAVYAEQTKGIPQRLNTATWRTT